jgi:Chaperone of endosialidase
MVDLNSALIVEIADNNTQPSPDGAAEQWNPNTVNNTLREHMGATKRSWNRINAIKTTTGTLGAYLLAYDVFGALTNGELITFATNHTSTNASTLKINSFTAYPVVYNDATAVTDIPSGTWLQVYFTGTTFKVFQFEDGFNGPTKFGTLSLASGSITDTSGAISFGDENLTTTGIGTLGEVNVGSTGIASGSEKLSVSGVIPAAFESSTSNVGVRFKNTTADGNLLDLMDSAGNIRGVVYVKNSTGKTHHKNTFGHVFDNNVYVIDASSHDLFTLGKTTTHTVGQAIKLLSSNAYNFQISSNFEVAGKFAISRSSAIGGSSFTNDDFIIDGSGDATFAGQISTDGAVINAGSNTLAGSVSSDWVCRINNTNATTPFGLTVQTTGAASDDNLSELFRCEDNTSIRMRVYSDGDVWTSDAGTLTSDERLKENIIDATSKLDDLMKLRVVNFNWKPYEDGGLHELGSETQQRKRLGFIAQEVVKIFPGLVSEHDVSTSDSKEKLLRYGVKEAKLVPMLVKAMQEQQIIIDAFETRLSALEAQA